jgi:formate dehydrogenase major subunit
MKRFDQRMDAHGSGRRSTPGATFGSVSRRPRPRLTTPLVREGAELRPAPWDEALDRVAEGFFHTRARHGPDSFGLFSCSKSTNETNYAAQKFARVVMGSNNIDSCNRT